MKLAVIGTGYVGLVTAACLAELGHDVIGCDKAKEKIDKISQGVVPIFEPELDELLQKNVKRGRLKFSSDLNQAIQSAEVIFVSVGTPQNRDGSADMTQIEEVSRSIAENLNSYKLVVEKSTVPLKTSHWIKRTISLYRRINMDFDVASNPEFLREGSAVSDFLNPDRIIIGVESERARELLISIYSRYKDRILITNIDTAELIKYASNTYLAMKISYVNLISNLCDKTEADVEMVAKGMGFDPRIGNLYLKAGLGFGGYCLPKDIRALIRIGEDLGVDMSLIKEADRINSERIMLFLEKVRRALWIIKDKTIAILGLSFKPGTDDIREAPSVSIISGLLKEGAMLRLYDPQAMPNVKELFPEQPPQLTYCSSPYQAAQGTNALLVLTEWEEFVRLDLGKVKEIMANPIIIDGRNIWDPAAVRRAGFEYYCLGRK
jgi:UDPglucose 6-dehydrogenase